MSAAKATTDHETIQRWVEERGGHPARVIGTGRQNGDPGILRIDYPGFSGEGKLEEISWDQFFEAFEENDLAFLYQEEDESRFSKLVARDTVDLADDDGELDEDERYADEEPEDYDDEDEDEEFDEDEDEMAARDTHS